MHFHICNNWVHDIIHNGMVLLSMAPDWIPLLRGWMLSRLARAEHRHDAA